MQTRVALDTGEVRTLVATLSAADAPAPTDREALALVRIYFYVANPLILPTISAELEAGGDFLPVTWRNFQLDEVTREDQFFAGCVKGMANRYLDRHPDPRDCHAVAEAECAKVDVFLTRNGALLKALGGQTESIVVTTPSAYWKKVQPPRGQPPRIDPASHNPLAAVDWWKW
jgi:hypothetical protein